MSPAEAQTRARSHEAQSLLVPLRDDQPAVNMSAVSGRPDLLRRGQTVAIDAQTTSRSMYSSIPAKREPPMQILPLAPDLLFPPLARSSDDLLFSFRVKQAAMGRTPCRSGGGTMIINSLCISATSRRNLSLQSSAAGTYRDDLCSEDGPLHPVRRILSSSVRTEGRTWHADTDALP